MNALLVIDMLNDFVMENAPLYVKDARRIIPCIVEEVKKAVENHYPVVYICDAHLKDDEEFNIWPSHCIGGSFGAEVIKELKPSQRDIVIKKTRYSGFFKTDLDKILKKLGIDRLVVTGLMTNVCILYTVADAVSLGYKVVVPEKCVISLDKNSHKFGLEQLKTVHHAEVR